MSPSRWPIWSRLTAFSPFLPCIELCLSGQPGGRRTQSLLHLSPPCQKNINLSVPTFMTLARVSLTPLTYLPTTPHPCPYWHPCYAVYFPPLCPLPRGTNLTAHQLFSTKLSHDICFSGCFASPYSPPVLMRSLREEIRQITEVESKI